ncbi:MAG TPA: hypothetical protein VMR81_04955 [Patescibacteria group bacterium]|nr:hypothetical protein [Patescibacteria group bacterium]
MDPITVMVYFVAILFALQCVTFFMILQMRLHQPRTFGSTLMENKAKTNSVLRKAIEQANKILVTAELKGIQLISKQKLSGGELTDQFNAHLATIEKALQDQLERNVAHTEEAYNSFITQSEEMIKTHISQNQKALEDKAEKMVVDTEGLLQKFTVEVEEKIKGEVAGELEKAKHEIEVYKGERMRVLDERIVDILEEVVRVTLDKKLTLADQSDFVYKALEQAKKDNAFGDKTPGAQKKAV